MSLTRKRINQTRSEFNKLVTNVDEAYDPNNFIVSEKNWKYAIVSCGANAYGQLSLSDSSLFSTNFQISKNSISEPTKIYCGTTSTSTIAAAGDSYVWGSGFPGSQLRVPIPINVKNILSISCGSNHVGVVTSDGKCYTWGNGEHGVLGHGNKQSIQQPKLVQAFIKCEVVSISCGSSHTAFIVNDTKEGGEGGGLSYIKIPENSINSARNRLFPTITTRRPSSTLPIISEAVREDDDTESFANSNEEEEDVNGVTGNKSGGSSISNTNDYLTCGSMYSCGQGKVGQLGHGDMGNKTFLLTPKKVAYFEENGLKVASISCGLHHTLILAVPVHAIRTFITLLYSCGWGEHGRLGHCNEELQKLPTEIKFMEPFHATQISAGSQHSCACGGGVAYSWGSNEFGQLGISNSSVAMMALSPSRITVPENVYIVKVVAGGHHTAAMTSSNKLLTWGWGEEGQLGHGNELNYNLPKPVRMPRVNDKVVKIKDIALGLCHTVILLENPFYSEVTAEVTKEITEESYGTSMLPLPISVPLDTSVNIIDTAPITPPVIPIEIDIVREPIDIITSSDPFVPPVEYATTFSSEMNLIPFNTTTNMGERKRAMLTENDDCIVSPTCCNEQDLNEKECYQDEIEVKEEDEEEKEELQSNSFASSDSSTSVSSFASTNCVRSLKDILVQRERRLSQQSNSDTTIIPVLTDENLQQQQVDKEEEGGQLSELAEVDKRVNSGDKNSSIQMVSAVNDTVRAFTQPLAVVNTGDVTDIFYRDGQNLEKCLVANTARRAEIRKSRTNLANDTSNQQQQQQVQTGVVTTVLQQSQPAKMKQNVTDKNSNNNKKKPIVVSKSVRQAVDVHPVTTSQTKAVKVTHTVDAAVMNDPLATHVKENQNKDIKDVTEQTISTRQRQQQHNNNNLLSQLKISKSESAPVIKSKKA